MKVYKIWIDVEEYDTETDDGELLAGGGTAQCVHTFQCDNVAQELALAFAEEVSDRYASVPEIVERIARERVAQDAARLAS